MARIGFLLTRTPWNDRRQYHRQGPSLLAAGHTVVYLAGIPDIEVDYGYEVVPLSPTERRAAALTGGLNLLRKIAGARLDVLQVCSVEQLPLGIAAKLLGLTKVVYDCREDMPSSMRDHKTWFPKPVRVGLSWLTSALEAIGGRLFDGLVTADPATANLSHVPEDRKVIFYNVAPLAHFPIDGPPLAERHYDVAIVGSMSELRGILDIIRAVALLRDRGTRLRVLIVSNNGYFHDAMRSLIGELGVTDQFEWRGPLDHLDTIKLLYNVRIGVVSLHDCTKYRRNIASKAFEFMAARMVTVATDLPPQRIFLEEEGNAMFYPAGNVGGLFGLAAMLSFLLDDLAFAQRIADQARRDFLNKWNLECVKAPYNALYDRLTNGPSPILTSSERLSA